MKQLYSYVVLFLYSCLSSIVMLLFLGGVFQSFIFFKVMGFIFQ
ncbi:hypothetical protein BvCmsKSP089_02818 [Escherichia coli]|nr:hypothetical protein BvCmsHHP016_02507 [Escherichia coli]GDN50015.1 hypothetical protein BvCmsKSP089_02818 [Escherichia coli]GDS94779.1 hypothetical protein BvCmsOUP043_01244 [Escherichia coli]